MFVARYVDKVGVAYTEDTVASGYGAHIALVSKYCNFSLRKSDMFLH